MTIAENLVNPQDEDVAFFMGDTPERAAEAAQFLKTLANGDRLTVLCALIDREVPVSELETRLGISQSSVSQHLARLRNEGFVRARRDGRNIYYSIADGRAIELMRLLYPMFCGQPPKQ